MSKKWKVLIPQDVPEEAKKELEDMGCVLKMGRGITEDAIIADIGDADALVARTAPITRRVLEAAPRLKIVSRFGVGVDNVDIDAATSMGIWVTNTPQANSATVAEHTVALMLALATDLVDSCNATRGGNFAYRNQVMGMDLGGKTLSIVGLGRIGRHLAQICKYGFGMNVIAYDPFLPEGTAVDGVTVIDDWNRAFREGDFVSLHLPLNDNTRGSVGNKEFALMKKTAYFINCSRGEIVRETDLIASIQAKEIAGAGLDVFEMEPPDPANPLFSLPNVVVTPHDSSFTHESFRRMGQHMVQNIREVFSGGAPAWPVNKPESRTVTV